MKKQYIRIFTAIVAIKLLLAYFFPITSDEAYFYTWSRHLSVNYYDHPPVTGWVVYLFSLLGHHIFFLRLFTIICGMAVAWGIYFIVKDMFDDKERAILVFLAFVVSPLHVLLVLITTDSALFLFVFLSGTFFYFGLKSKKSLTLVLSGIFLSLAILSKYFAALTAISYVAYWLKKRDRVTMKAVLIVAFSSLPLVLLHIYWNYNNCWTNIMFNMINRNKSVSPEFTRFLSFIGFQLYLATPWVIWYMVKDRARIKAGIKKQGLVFLFIFAVPIFILGLVSFHNTGLHWFISFYPFLFFLLAFIKKSHIEKIIKFSAVFSLIHLIVIFTLVSLPVETFNKAPYYHDLVLCEHGDEIFKKLRQNFGPGYVYATNGYYTSGAMAYESGTRFIVFLDFSKHGRQDDKLTDFRSLDGKNILILSTLPIDRDYSVYFDKMKISKVNVRGKDFNVVLGLGFRFKVYRQRFLRKILDDWYNIPWFLPVGDCYFYDLYFPEQYSKKRKART